MTDIGYMYAQTKNSSNYLVLDSDNVEISNNLIVLGGDASFNNNVKIGNELTVTGQATFNNTIIGDINGNAATVTNGIYTTSNGSSGQFLKYLSPGIGVWADDNNTQHGIGYTTNTNHRNYGVRLSGVNMYVNVPWVNTDTNTTYSVGDGGLTEKNFTSTLKTRLDGLSSTSNVTFKYVFGDRLYTKFQQHDANNGYNSAYFTGSHGNINNFNFNVNINYNGLIVSCGDQYINIDYSMKPTISESLPLTKLTTIENDKAVFGVVAYQEDASYNINKFKVNSLGEGAIWVTNKNGNLDIGDYISSSNITGYGQKQNDDLLHNYTVAKITCNCEFSLVKQIKQKIITISNENYINEEYVLVGQSKDTDYKQYILYDENGNIQFEDDLDPSGNQVFEYKFDTRFLDASANILNDENDYLTRLNAGENVYIACFVGCTYHCG